MEQGIRALCALSILCGAAGLMVPEGSGRRAMGFVCTLVLLSAVVLNLRTLDWEEYALDAALIRKREEEFLQQAEENRKLLDRLVIEREYEEYILTAAREMGIELQDLDVGVQWNLDGLWVPHDVHLIGEWTDAERTALSERLEADLGIPDSRQTWRQNGAQQLDTDPQ